MPAQKFERFIARNDLDRLSFGECRDCKETVVFAMHKKTVKSVVLEPKPVGGSEVNPLYDRHACKKVE